MYDPTTAERLAFIGKAKALGLTLDEVREVLRVAAAGMAPCEHVRATLSRRLREIEARIAELSELRSTLARALRRSRKRSTRPSSRCGGGVDGASSPPGEPDHGPGPADTQP